MAEHARAQEGVLDGGGGGGSAGGVGGGWGAGRGGLVGVVAAEAVVGGGLGDEGVLGGRVQVGQVLRQLEED